jgi:hypothetical protein
MDHGLLRVITIDPSIIKVWPNRKVVNLAPARVPGPGSSQIFSLVTGDSYFSDYLSVGQGIVRVSTVATTFPLARLKAQF